MNLLYEKPFLIANLSFFYRVIVASEPLLQFAIQHSEGGLRMYYERHALEEAGHEVMLAEDLKNLGMEDIPLCFSAAQLAGSQYYLIAHHHPAMLLGYMVVLESNSLRLDRVRDLEQHHGVPLTALAYHAEHDPQHFKDLIEEIRNLPPEIRNAVHWNTQCTALALQNVVDSLRTN